MTLHLGWTADDRPVWHVAGSYLEGQRCLGEERREQVSRLRSALEATGRTRGSQVVTADGRVTVVMRIKADDEPAAIGDAATIIDHAAARSASRLLGDVAAIRVHAPGGIPAS